MELTQTAAFGAETAPERVTPAGLLQRIHEGSCPGFQQRRCAEQ